jgi:hypothetical protein
VRALIKHGANVQHVATDVDNGEAAPVEPMKPKSKAPGTKRSKLKNHNLLSSFGFNFNSRWYTTAPRCTTPASQAVGRKLFNFADC